jgi:hypothetical protein
VFAKLEPRPPIAKLLAAIEQQKKSAAWTRDNGKGVPLLANWLEGEEWNNETQETANQAERIKQQRIDQARSNQQAWKRQREQAGGQ